jgi:hypothetical protein
MFINGGILIAYHCPLFPYGTIVGKFIETQDNPGEKVIISSHPDISGIAYDQLHLFGIEPIPIFN